ncbi:MarR family transcriptional regulator [Rhodococcus sp. D2-41]|uniref:MarR family transcriptional regulator n=1 Tax=Speluncibacter jeojiensis TaxID=2710754 RepID=A0A9X4RFD1_9ACTN|nr:MarR family transcriptional regulator [Rhodococcus sp. D2-41]MDG3009318.1 MarR family transcriptional regulator [Rhodococcus sp. D2-41]MDG3016895.1 MarR family transcriptional regulator [Corynebacteriales bacterium D3-21]
MTADVRVASEPGIEPYADELANQLGRMQRVRERTMHQLGSRGPGGLDLAAFRCLFALIEQGPMRSGALAEAVLSDPSTVSRHVAQLVQLGHLERLADPEDGRASVIAVTQDGRRAAAEMRHRRNARFSQVIEHWSMEDRDALLRLLTQLIDDQERVRLVRAAECAKDAPDRTGSADTSLREQR